MSKCSPEGKYGKFQASLEEMQQKNPRLSLRALARKLGISPGCLTELMQGKRPLSEFYASKVVLGLEMGPEERNQVYALITTRSRKFDAQKTIADKELELLKSWEHFAVLNLIRTKDFQSEPAWIAERLAITLGQAVIQFRQPNILGYRYYIDKNVWAQLNDNNKAALVLHELIYREGLKEENNITTSVGVRYLNGILHSELMETMTLRKYIEEVLGYKAFVDADANGVRIRLHTPISSTFNAEISLALA